MQLPIGGPLPGAGPTDIIPGGRGPIIGILGGSPLWGADIIPGRGGPGRLGEGGILTPAGGGTEEGVRGIFPVERLRLLFNCGLILLLHPLLIIVFHILVVFPTAAMCVCLAGGESQGRGASQ